MVRPRRSVGGAHLEALHLGGQPQAEGVRGAQGGKEGGLYPGQGRGNIGTTISCTFYFFITYIFTGISIAPVPPELHKGELRDGVHLVPFRRAHMQVIQFLRRSLGQKLTLTRTTGTR